MIPFLIVLVLLIAFGVLGAVVKGLLWLTAIAALLIVAFGVYGWFKFKGSRLGSGTT